LSDNAGIIIKALQNRATWGAEQKGLLEQLIHMPGRKQYITFVGHQARYRLTQIGQSCLMDVRYGHFLPVNVNHRAPQRGHVRSDL